VRLDIDRRASPRAATAISSQHGATTGHSPATAAFPARPLLFWHHEELMIRSLASLRS
jgi:hypothetical protein